MGVAIATMNEKAYRLKLTAIYQGASYVCDYRRWWKNRLLPGSIVT